jgi:hypothetical protein
MVYEPQAPPPPINPVKAIGESIIKIARNTAILANAIKEIAGTVIALSDRIDALERRIALLEGNGDRDGKG